MYAHKNIEIAFCEMFQYASLSVYTPSKLESKAAELPLCIPVYFILGYLYALGDLSVYHHFINWIIFLNAKGSSYFNQLPSEPSVNQRFIFCNVNNWHHQIHYVNKGHLHHVQIQADDPSAFGLGTHSFSQLYSCIYYSYIHSTNIYWLLTICPALCEMFKLQE